MNWQTATVLTGGVATLAIFSFLIRENPFFRVFEHLFIGISAGFGVVFTLKNFLWPQVLVPMLGLGIVQYPDGSYSAEYNRAYLLYLVPMVFGLFYYFIYSRRYGWLAKLVIGFALGASGGLAFKGFFNQVMPQIFSSFRPLLVLPPGAGGIDWLASLENLFFVFTLLSVMYYFFFSFKHESRAAGAFAHSGRWLLMICFGAFFGSTIMARMALLVERLQFLLGDWRQALFSLFS